jgi:hypothetical protein
MRDLRLGRQNRKPFTSAIIGYMARRKIRGGSEPGLLQGIPAC